MEGNTCPERRISYVGLPRTASRYIWSILRQSKFITSRPDQVHTHAIPCNQPGWTYLVSCRNPYQRVVSMYNISKNIWKHEWKNFEEFIHNYRFSGIYESVKHLENIKWIHFENIPEDLGDLYRKEPYTFIESDSSKNWRKFYNSKLEKIVYERYKSDFINCGYNREIL